MASLFRVIDPSFHTVGSYRRSLASQHSMPMVPRTRRAGRSYQRISAGDESGCAIGPTASVTTTTERRTGLGANSILRRSNPAESKSAVGLSGKRGDVPPKGNNPALRAQINQNNPPARASTKRTVIAAATPKLAATMAMISRQSISFFHPKEIGSQTVAQKFERKGPAEARPKGWGNLKIVSTH